MTTGLHVIHPGLFTTVQDRGRTGYREWGVPVSGAFAQEDADLANALLGNPPDCATLELTMFGGIYRATTSLAIALAGAPMEITITGDERGYRLSVPSCRTLAPGAILRIGGAGSGARAYLAVKGGWQYPAVLGSRSTEVPLSEGETIPAGTSATPTRHLVAESWHDPAGGPIRIIEGPDSRLHPRLLEGLVATYRVGAESDRMGLRLDGPALIAASSSNRVSTPVSPGAVQVAGGRLLILGVACGTMGGYPHIAHVITADLGRIGQLRPGDAIRLQRIGIDEARRIDREDRARRGDRFRRISALASDDFTFSSRG